MPLYEVARIVIERGICHIVDFEIGGMSHTLCDFLTTRQSCKTWPLKAKICRACRKRLKQVSVQIKDAKQ